MSSILHKQEMTLQTAHLLFFFLALLRIKVIYLTSHGFEELAGIEGILHPVKTFLLERRESCLDLAGDWVEGQTVDQVGKDKRIKLARTSASCMAVVAPTPPAGLSYIAGIAKIVWV